MDEKLTEAQKVTRRRALQVIGVGVTATSSVVLAACKKEEKKPAKKAAAVEKKAEKPAEKPAAKAGGGDGLNCTEGVELDQQSKTMRKTLKYVDKTEKEGKNCANCMQWKPASEVEGLAADSKCGGCKLFSGPVNPNGWCLSYAPKKKAG